MRAICEICGLYSEDDRCCTNCGAEIPENEEFPPPTDLPHWGWAIFAFGAMRPSIKVCAIAYLREKWVSLEESTILSLFKPQVSRFSTESNEIKVIIREDYLSKIKQEMPSEFDKVSIIFEVLDFNTAAQANELLIEEWGKSSASRMPQA